MENKIIQTDNDTHELLRNIFNNQLINTVIIDADDTIWYDNKYFYALKSELKKLCFFTEEEKGTRIFKDKLAKCGLGEKEYAKAIEMTAKSMKINSENKNKLFRAIENFLNHDIEVMPEVKNALANMSKYNRILLTKGCEGEQKEKLRRSNLSHFFDKVMVVERKDHLYFSALIKHAKLMSTEIIVVGNSIRHDIIPAVKSGAPAIWMNHSNNMHGRNEVLPETAIEVSGWEPIVKALATGCFNAS